MAQLAVKLMSGLMEHLAKVVHLTACLAQMGRHALNA
jgi:hypothetical protein